MKALHNIFFYVIEKFRVLTQDDLMRKRMTTEERCCQGVRGWRIRLSLQSAEVLSGKVPCRKTYLENQASPPCLTTAIRDVHSEIFVKAKAGGELVPK